MKISARTHFGTIVLQWRLLVFIIFYSIFHSGFLRNDIVFSIWDIPIPLGVGQKDICNLWYGVMDLSVKKKATYYFFYREFENWGLIKSAIVGEGLRTKSRNSG